MEDKWNDLQAIEAERNDLITKLEKIENKKTSVSFEVYEKVKNDYEKKLAELDKKIAQNAELLKGEISRMQEEGAKLDDQEKEIRLRLEEAELRYSIGEYDDTAFKDVAEEDKKQVDMISDRRNKIREKVAWLEKFMTEKAAVPEEIEKEAPPKVEEQALTIDEHILEEKLPVEEQKLDELLVQEAATPEIVKIEVPPPPAEPVKKKGEKGVPCPKCGTVNAPDSWYCEKCGAEILSSPSQ